MKKKIIYQKIFKNRLYTEKRLQDSLKVSRSTISYWIRNGLKPIFPGKGPYFFEGESVKNYLRQRAISKKTNLNPGEIYCFACRRGVRADEQSLEIIDTGIAIGKGLNTKIVISGRCADCGTKVNLIWSRTRLSEFINNYPYLSTQGVKVKFNKATSKQ